MAAGLILLSGCEKSSPPAGPDGSSSGAPGASGEPGPAVPGSGVPAAAAGGERRLVVVGLDAADLRLIEKGIASGSLPAFARMVREGVSGPLRTHQPMLSPILWTTIATGVTPDRHGVLDFVESDAKGRTVPVTSRSRRASAFWEILGERGVSCGIVGWLATYPADPVRGYLVSDRFTIHPFEEGRGAPPAEASARTWPADLDAALRPLAVDPGALADADLAKAFGTPARFPDSDARERRELSVIEAVARTYTSVALRLDEERRPRCLAVYYEAIDRLMHLFGDVMPPALPGAGEGKARRYGVVVDRFYAAMDARLAELMRAAGDGGTVLVVSDHGFKIGDERPRHEALRSDVFAAEWHRDPGVILAWGKGVRRGARIADADLYDIAPTVLAFFGAPASTTMRGRALAELFEPGFLPPAPALVPDYERAASRPPESADGATAGKSAPEDEEILENLRALGYIGGAADAEARASSNLATFYLEEKQYDRAIALYERALAKDPRDLTALYNLGYAYRGMGANARAAESFERLLRERPDYMEARLVLSDVYVALGRPGDALALLQQRAAEGRTDPGWQNHLGTVLASAGRPQEAAAAFERAIALRPGEASPYLNLARLLLSRGDRRGAATALMRARTAVPDDPRIASRLRELEGR